MLRFLETGRWAPGQVISRWVSSTRRVVPEVEAIIENTWQAALSRPGITLFDGPMCRLESFHASTDLLELNLSPTSYKPFFGTNMSNPQLASQFGAEVMANPVGVSTALLTADNWLLLGRRNQSVAYYPGRVHPFAGSLEPKDVDVFAAATRELREELSLGEDDIAQMLCTGLVQDKRLNQPELIFAATSLRSRDEIAAQLDLGEHRAIYSVAATASDVQAAASQSELTPVATAALLLWGRIEFGQEWFARAAARVCG